MRRCRLERAAAAGRRSCPAARRRGRRSPGRRRTFCREDGYLTREGARTDAILFEASERGVDRTFEFGVPYRPKSLLRKAAPIGDIGYHGARAGSLLGRTAG